MVRIAGLEPDRAAAVERQLVQWLSAQFADTGPFTVFIVLVHIRGDEVAR